MSLKMSQEETVECWNKLKSHCLASHNVCVGCALRVICCELLDDRKRKKVLPKYWPLAEVDNDEEKA